MDFLYEELLRQRRALAALLLGREPPEEQDGGRAWSPEPEPEPKGARFSAAKQAGAAGRRDAAWASEEGGGGTAEASGREDDSRLVWAGTRHGADAVGPWSAGAGTDGVTETLLETWEASEEEEETLHTGGRTSQGPSGKEGAFPKGASGDRLAFRRLEGPENKTLFSAGPDLGQTAEEDWARAASRAFQRDARRYDGGFALYH